MTQEDNGHPALLYVTDIEAALKAFGDFQGIDLREVLELLFKRAIFI
jgi:hypothetical protein